MDSANWSFGTPGAPCDDGDPCTAEDLCSDEGQCLPGEPLICSGDNPCEDYACGAEGLCEATWKEANAPCGEGICDAAGTCLLSCTAPALEGAECNFFCGQGEQGCGADQVCALEAGAQSCVNAEVATGGLLAPCSGPDSLCESGYVCAYLEAEQGKRCLPVCSDYADGESACPDGLACELDMSLSLGGDTASTLTLCVPTEAPCPVPFEDLCPCPIPQGAACSPYCGASEQGCAEGTSCTVAEAGDTLLCAETGTLKAGEPCATWDECDVGLTCASGESGLACRSFCQSDSECAEIFPSTECELVPLSGGVEVGICTEHLACDLPYPTGAACNAYCPAGAQGCAEGETCILNESNTFECSSGGGDLSTDAPCLSHEACMSGHVCINSPFQAEKTCQPFCVTSDECPEGRECNIWYYAGADEEFQMWMCEPPPCEGCVIDEVCVPEGAPQPDAPCSACVSASNPTGWTMTPDAACDDADPCTDEDTCGLFGECIGSPSSSPECNGCFITAPIGAACNPYCPMGAQGCEDGQGCLFVDATQSFICGDVGEGSLDAPCSSNSSCQTGHICTSIQTQTSFLCNKVCTSDDDCPAERPCAASYALDSETLTMCEADPCPGGCFIDDVCYPDASAHPTFACQVCNTALSTSAWSLNLGAACDDGDPCTEGSTCGEAGVCQGGQAMPIGTPCPANPTLHALYACDFGGECSFSACEEGFLNCNLSLIDGCEAEVATDPLNCGGCEIACSESDSPANVDVCIDGECAVASCESVSNETDLATSDANGDPSDGCELVCEQTHVDCVYEEVNGLGQPISTGCETMVIELPEESCNGLDDDCDGLTDEGIPGAESDLDGDLTVDCMDPDIDGDGVDNLQDPSDYNAYICGDSDDDGCDDCASLAVSAPLFDGLDTDSDGLCNVGDPDDDGDNIPDTLDGCPLAIDQGLDNDVDGYDIACDCDDSRSSINPGASEACDGVDTDCDGILPDDEKDLDQDSFVGCDYQGMAWLGSNPPSIGKDCDDTNHQHWEKLSDTELCDGVDSDCDGVLPEEELDLDGDGYVACMNEGEAWLGLSGEPMGFADCDPTSPSVFPGAEELCDGVQNNCSALAIPDNEVDNDGDGYIECDGWQTEGWLSPDPVPLVGIDCDDTDTSVNPGAVELCDGLSNTCAEEVPADEVDHDGDGYVACPFNQAIWAGDPTLLEASTARRSTQACLNQAVTRRSAVTMGAEAHAAPVSPTSTA